MTDIERLKHTARLLHAATLVAMVTLPIVITVGFLLTPMTPAALKEALGTMAISPDATFPQMAAAVGLQLISPVILLLTLNEMRKLFSAYGKGDVLTDYCALLIQRIGRGFVALSVLPFLVQPVQSVLLSLANPPGQRALSIGITSNMVFFGIAGGLIIVIGWAMRAASDVAAENRAFI